MIIKNIYGLILKVRKAMTEKNGTLNWFKIAWPILAFVILLALGGMAAFNDQGKDIAVMQTENKNYATGMTELKADVKDIKTDIKKILMNSVK